MCVLRLLLVSCYFVLQYLSKNAIPTSQPCNFTGLYFLFNGPFRARTPGPMWNCCSYCHCSLQGTVYWLLFAQQNLTRRRQDAVWGLSSFKRTWTKGSQDSSCGMPETSSFLPNTLGCTVAKDLRAIGGHCSGPQVFASCGANH